MDVAGMVEAVGQNVTRFQAGDEVFGTCDGAFAEYARAREDTLAPKPANLTFEQAAAVPTSACTALKALRDAGGIQSGQKVLIVGASGGVGMFAVQIAKSFGAEVTGVCSTAKLDMVRSIGADHVIDYTRDDFTRGGQRYDLILDMGGNRSLSQLRRALTPAARSCSSAAKGADGGSAADGSLAASRRAVTVRQPATADDPRTDPQRRPQVPDRARRDRPGHPRHRPDLSAEQGARRPPPAGSRERTRGKLVITCDRADRPHSKDLPTTELTVLTPKESDMQNLTQTTSQDRFGRNNHRVTARTVGVALPGGDGGRNRREHPHPIHSHGPGPRFGDRRRRRVARGRRGALVAHRRRRRRSRSLDVCRPPAAQ